MKVNNKIENMRNNTYIKIVQRLLFLALVFFGTIGAMGQVNMTKIKDGTVNNSDRLPFNSAILELESLTKGFLTPRMNTTQRDNITNKTDGLMIYNTTTGCFNYWSKVQDNWLSLCGTPPPATFSISAVQCSELNIQGTYKQGDFLNESNYILVAVTVTQAGTYDVTATTDPDNGYYFSTDGTFPTTGTYTLILKGVGTPAKGNENPGDKLKILLNGKQSTCNDKHVLVSPANVDYTISCTDIVAEGKYNIGVPLGKNNVLKVKVKVVSGGTWAIKTNTLNGYSFSGTGKFTPAQIGTDVVVSLSGNGMPEKFGTNQFNLDGNASSNPSCTNIPVVVEDVAFTVDCTKIKVNGSYMHDVELNSSNTITVPVDITATGKAKFETNTVDGVFFTTGGEVTLDALGVKNIPLVAVGKPTSSSDKVFTLSASKGLAAPCDFTVKIAAQPVSYTMLCSSNKVAGKYAPNKAMDASNTMTLNVNVEYAGAYSVKTNTLNGVYFEGNGNFTSTGTQEIVLTAVGTPKKGGMHSFTLTSNTTSGSNTCTQDVLFIYRTMRVLGLGHGVYSPGSGGSSSSSRGILQNKSNFGPNGTVQVENIIVENGAEPWGGPDQASIIRNAINGKKIDIIVLSHNFIPDPATVLVLKDFVHTKKGVLIHAQENSHTSAQNLINAIGEGSVSLAPGAGGSRFNKLYSTASDVVLDGPFMKLIPGSGKPEILMGSDVNNSFHVSTIFGAGEDFKTLYTNQGGNYSWMIKHKDLGYIYCGDSGWIAGSSGNTNQDVWPAGNSGGKPIPKIYNAPGGVTNVYNAFLYANVIAWAIDYASNNTKVDHQVQ